MILNPFTIESKKSNPFSLCIFLCFADISEICCREVLSYVAGEINEDWFHFLIILSNGSNVVKAMQDNGKSGKDNVNAFYESISFQVKWKDLVSTLLSMEKILMVSYMEKNFLYTQGKLIEIPS